ncbi:MAG: ABC transporter permease [Nitrososphaerales archaeon]
MIVKQSNLLQLLVLAIILIFWQVLPAFLNNSYLYVPLSSVLSSYGSLLDPSNQYLPGGLLASTYTTIYELAASFVIAATAGVLIGFALGYFKLIGEAYEPMVYLLYSIPGAILYPIDYLAFGTGPISKIIIASFLGVFPSIINTASGVRTVKQSYVKLARSVGASSFQTFWKVYLPAIASYIISGLRLTLSFVFIGVIFAELIAADNGLGWAIGNLQANFQIPGMYAVILEVIVLAYIFLEASVLVERAVIPHSRH